MTNDQTPKSQGPVVDEYKGKPILRVPLVDTPDPTVSWHWISFGKSKGDCEIFR